MVTKDAAGLWVIRRWRGYLSVSWMYKEYLVFLGAVKAPTSTPTAS